MTRDHASEPAERGEERPAENPSAPPASAAEAKGRPARPADKEKALGLEVARLFGMDPRLLVRRPSPPVKPSPDD